MGEVETPGGPAKGRPKLPVVGEQLLDYQVVRFIAGGGMARLYEAIDVRLDRPVALKVMLPAVDPELEKRFEREGRLLAKLQHPHLIAVHASGTARGLRFLVLEYVHGATPWELVSLTGPLPPEIAVEAVLQASRGLLAAHEAGIIHRDLKPENLIINRDGVVKVLDFGIGKDLSSQSFLTSAGAVVGTANYVAPESLTCAPVDERADIYGLGLTLYHLITGEIPYDVSPTVRVLQLVRSEPAPRLDGRTGVSPELAEVCTRMTSKSPELRQRDMAEVGRDLANAALTLSAPSSPYELATLVRKVVSAPQRPPRA